MKLFPIGSVRRLGSDIGGGDRLELLILMTIVVN
jgi:hypothetical protein